MLEILTPFLMVFDTPILVVHLSLPLCFTLVPVFLSL